MPQPLANEPRDLLLGTDNDLVITTDLQWVRGVDAIAQSCRIALQMFQGEWFLDLDVGVPYWDGILGKKTAAAMALARTELTEELLSVEGVLEVTKMELSFQGSTRALSVRWQVRTALGETPVDTLSKDIA